MGPVLNNTDKWKTSTLSWFSEMPVEYFALERWLNVSQVLHISIKVHKHDVTPNLDMGTHRRATKLIK